MATLQPFAQNIWTALAPHSFVGLHIGTRLTVIRLSSGKLLLHSPIPLSVEVRSAIHGPAALQRKRKDLRFDAVLTDQPHPDWRGDLELLTIEGCILGETVFYHPATRTLIACDLVENFHQSPHWLTRNYLRLGGILGRVSWHPLLRMAYRDRKRARACIDTLLAWPFERVVLAHGDLLTDDAHALVREGMAWL
jgi:hypothetical protein